MSKVKSIWSKADAFLSTTRKLILNTFTVLVLIFVTVAIFGAFGAMFTEDEEIDTENKVLWFKPIGVVVDNATSSARHHLTTYLQATL